MSDDLHAWWWNGCWGRLVRRDLKVFVDGEGFRVEAISGGVEGEIRRWLDLDGDAMSALVLDLMSDSDGWRSMINNS